VAVKTALAEKADPAGVRRRLRTEAACARRLPSFCTVELLVDGTDQTRPYLISDYVEGPSLEQFVDDVGPLEPPQVKAVAVAVAKALAAVHRAGLIHGDLKPAHVLLAADGPRLIDFGIAQEIPAAGGSAEIGAVADSPGWMAPERATGGPVGPAADVFGWGCLVRYAATGRSPFAEVDADGPGWQTVPEPAELNAWDEPLRGLVKAALANDPADRPTADHLASRLGAVDRDPTARTPEAGTAMLPRSDAAPAAATNPAPVLDTELTTGGPRRPRWAKALVVTSVPVTLAAVLIAVIAGTGRDAGRHIPLGPGRTGTAPVQEVSGSSRPTVQGPRSRRSGVPRPASVAGAHTTPGSQMVDHLRRHRRHAGSGAPGSSSGPGRPGGSSAPTVPSASSPAVPSSPTAAPTPSPTPSPTTTKSG
jgi:eukaryotic-like serine/threonine-protein kinase